MAEKPAKLNLSALSVADLAKVLAAAGSASASPETIQKMLADGAPSNPDKTINLVHFTAWMLRELNARK